MKKLNKCPDHEYPGATASSPYKEDCRKDQESELGKMSSLCCCSRPLIPNCYSKEDFLLMEASAERHLCNLLNRVLSVAGRNL